MPTFLALKRHDVASIIPNVALVIVLKLNNLSTLTVNSHVFFSMHHPSRQAKKPRLSEFKLGMGDVIKRIGTARRRPASSCNALAVDTFSS